MRRRALLLLAAALAVPAAAQNAFPGQALFSQYCATCHGANLQGGAGPSLVDAEWIHGSDEAAVAHVIAAGVLERGMPAFGEALTEQQVDDLVGYLAWAAENADDLPDDEPDPLQTLDYKLSVEVVAGGLEIPWAIDFLDERTALVTERPGRLRVIEDGVLRPEPVADIPEVLHEGQGGLLDVAVGPTYAEDGWIYLAYSHPLPPRPGEEGRAAMTRVVRGRLDGNAWTDQEVVFEAPHETYRVARHHYGSRIVFDPEGYLFFSIGDRGAQDQAQDLSRPNGKVHRIWPDGTIPEDNPFVGREGVLPSIYSYGHRNPQGLAVHPATGEVWDVEHGPRGGDELNRVEAGRNYGWPVITYGINYSGTIVTDTRRRPGMEQPNLFWRPSIAVSGLDFYDGDLFEYWKGGLLVGALAQQEVRLLTLAEDRVLHQEVILKNAGRVREAVTGPDGAIYVVLNNPGMVMRIAPAGEWEPQ